MLAEIELDDYLNEIRQEVCSKCVERPPGGPPCLPLGKVCGVELHLPRLVEAVREVHSELIEPYLDNNRKKICESCAFLHTGHCPCPMDSLAVLVVEAIETVDARSVRPPPEVARPADEPREPGELDEVLLAYREATGTWTGCDWPTGRERGGMNLEGRTSADAAELARTAPELEEGEVWAVAARWLRLVEHRARLAEGQAALAVAAARGGRWMDAVEHARRAWALEFSTGRPIRREPPAWRRLFEAIVDAAWARTSPEAGGAVETG
jgi:hypothetical protein